ncbi:hypothetical protein SF1_38820 [Sphingobacterium faecium NBRC 15299]|nr:hypothetical protein C8N37_11162 [Sphingobacterium faecium]GEM65900.1 hypothetical protein SF1_38820 [Sphingobacterium faecium NBRC 15299]CDS91589.1 hypothetical protein BN1088_1410003 [Sphingobacterium sp. PM2-P1-29]
MDISVFSEKKQNLIDVINCALNKTDIIDQERESLNALLDVVNQYTYKNRLQKKGFLSHFIIDSLDVGYSYGENFIKFDNEIS